MDKLASVKGKLECVFEIAIVNKPSSKRPNQVFRVSATDTLRQEAKDHGIDDALASEKIDGTCVFITPFNGKVPVFLNQLLMSVVQVLEFL